MALVYASGPYLGMSNVGGKALEMKADVLELIHIW